MKVERASRLAALPILASVTLLAVVHFAVSVGTHSSHVTDVILGGLYLFPILAGSLWFGLAGGFLTALGVGAGYLAHDRIPIAHPVSGSRWAPARTSRWKAPA
jgi:hypothetical protein